MGANTGVINLRKYLHWHKDGVIPEHFFVDGAYQDAVLFSMRKDDYYRLCRKILMRTVAFGKEGN